MRNKIENGREHIVAEPLSGSSEVTQNGSSRKNPREKESEVIKSRGWLGEVEGLRGLASLWVFLFHTAVACGASLPVITSGGRGVDLFILISGFIMVHQVQQRKAAEPWNEPSTLWRFWIRRFFRMAPLYYPLLILSLTFGGIWGTARDVIESHYPSAATDMARYSDPSIMNFLTHLSFTFGALPQFAFRTPLPDWTIGLEFQFYAVFPFLMLLVLKFGYPKTILAVSALSLLIAFLLTAHYRSLAIPSFLPSRMYLFAMGMLIAARMHSATGRILPLLVILPIGAHIMVAGINSKVMIGQILLASLLYVVTTGPISALERVVVPIRRFLSHRIIQKIGLLSYSIYLVHSLILLPVSALLLKQYWYPILPSTIRFLISFCASASIVLPLSLFFYHWVERPGVRFGKWLAGKILSQSEDVIAPRRSVMESSRL